MFWFDENEDVTAQFWGGGRVAVIVKMPGTGRSVPM